ncbi:acyltransferase [Sphingomonas sp. PL-96]|uniref:acyltransferase family protein n=1 Tax=Sphingomonas sp. PL-96 TaxID=2887201 RepID=UPI001E64407F|nr:acyltransferase [Sphingomonas sp. PL-96]MCC2976608.1 acyltransferase [Sphingomonas sp. PL-96]
MEDLHRHSGEKWSSNTATSVQGCPNVKFPAASNDEVLNATSCSTASMNNHHAVSDHRHAARPAVSPDRRAVLWPVQVMRATAATMVVIGHSQSAVAWIKQSAGQSFVRSTMLPWGASVDLFFVISGFIMVYASRHLFGQPRAPIDFLKRRLIRIVPLYWVVTTVFLALLLAATLKGGDRFPSGAAIVASYAFLPFDTYGDRQIFPVFDLGWTLNYEMFFYALFTLAVSLPRRRAVAIIAAVLLLLVALGTAVPETQVALHFWTRPILLDFGLGMAVGLGLSEGVRLSGRMRIALGCVATALLVLDPANVFNGALGTTVANDWPRVLVAGVPAAALLAAATLGPEPRFSPWVVPLTRVGDASYSLYLLHPVTLIVLGKLAQKLPSVTLFPGGALVAAAVIAAVALALASFRWGERPMTAWIARRLDKKHRRPAQEYPPSQETAT